MKSSDDCAEYFWRQKSQNFEFSFEGGGRFGQGCDLARALHSKEGRIEGGAEKCLFRAKYQKSDFVFSLVRFLSGNR